MVVGVGLVVQMNTAAHAERRVALVIGNDKYEHLDTLQKAVADAGAYADVLKAKGFDQVILKTDLSRAGMDEAIATFIDQIQPGDTAVFAYSGHGWSDGTQNYIVGTDAPVTGSQDFLARISIPLKNGINGIIDEMDQKGATLKVAVIDACRDNPFTPPPGKKGVGLSRGLVRIEPPHGTFVVFSAGAGQSALDRLSDADQDPNSVFTRVFVPAIRADLTLQDAIKTTQEKVVELAKTIHEDQEPAYSDQVIGSACLSANCNGVGTPAHIIGPPSGNDAIAADYQAAAAVGTAAAWNLFLKRHGAEADNFYVSLAKENQQKLAALTPPASEPAKHEAAPTDCPGGRVASVGNAGVAAAADRCLKPKDVFRDCADVCPEMVVVPAGNFTMGSPASEKDHGVTIGKSSIGLERGDNEGPEHKVTIGQAFAVGRFAVTFDEWDTCVSEGGCAGYKPLDQGWGRGRRPVINVSWNDAKAYVDWLSRKSGKTYRLLSEAEWEYAARAGTTTPWWWGMSVSDDQLKWVGKTVQVDSIDANPFGLYIVPDNFRGNIREWVEDCYHDSYNQAPMDGSAWKTETDCGARVLRGRSWYNGSSRSAYRYGYIPFDRSSFDGFRVARTLGALAALGGECENVIC